MTIPIRRRALRHLFAVSSLFAAAVAFPGPLSLAAGGLAITPAGIAEGTRLLHSSLPAGTALEKADCAVLARSVHAAVLAKRNAAGVILVAALCGNNDIAHPVKRDCECVSALFRAAVTAAPDKGVALLEDAVALYPDCGESLTAAVQRLEGKNVVTPDGKDGLAPSSAANDSGTRSGQRDSGLDSFGNPATLDGASPSAAADSNDPNGPDGGMSGRGAAVPGTLTSGLSDGFGAGFGPGFPGSPGFSGSAPGGSSAVSLPSPVVVPATSAANN